MIIKSMLKDNSAVIDEKWPYIAKIWSTSPAVYEGLIGASARKPFESVIVELLVERPDGERTFRDHLLDNNKQIVAYCLVGLRRIYKSDVPGIPHSLYNNREVVRWRAGSLGQDISLGEFARSVAGLTKL